MITQSIGDGASESRFYRNKLLALQERFSSFDPDGTTDPETKQYGILNLPHPRLYRRTRPSSVPRAGSQANLRVQWKKTPDKLFPDRRTMGNACKQHTAANMVRFDGLAWCLPAITDWLGSRVRKPANAPPPQKPTEAGEMVRYFKK